jgi:hypothetical protein
MREKIDSLNAGENLSAKDFMTKEESKKVREQWVLRQFTAAYNSSNSPKFKYAESGEAPDFIVFADFSDVEGRPIEIAELLEPGRKRDVQYKSGIKIRENPAPEPDYESRLAANASELLSRKFKKGYPSGTWLVVYFNPDKGIFQDDLLCFATRVMSDALESIPAPTAISEIWILTNRGEVARIYPKE